ncbi:hypothetical protein Pan153_57960 [Gimesia panareensis]|uniref:Uncharacterized protein n=1 Tax=Gimesia panareensis TaxID=2527978 RepID=A0A518FXU1_9PLAN|nr:hypothetical protein Pan153_57960 [Gimesia panareensis]
MCLPAWLEPKKIDSERDQFNAPGATCRLARQCAFSLT